ncbi:N-acetylglucosamine-specific PTS transporter subunit IIBC [Staphylococcus massiliensis]|uniref:N-acetylglucosamine-specific PTS transporter subunit IIBC n=1 Tax=Staphylococcus massiliensis TaxID=555791 RepID=UPI001EDE7EB6|nr:N-acetylglucosamine-specific PTS transporter subunit IIBC [Staphylococcus massiliensis]MCG3400844.1 N-acetylglucosamine-specific PTS transporter subunit IIBC [Staphylococcus massiliensis]
MYNFIQRLGRSLMLPVAVLPAAALIMAIGNGLEYTGMVPPVVYEFFKNGGNAILGQLGLLFAIGIAIGMSKKNDGAVALAAVVGFFMVTSILDPESLAKLLQTKVDLINPGFEKINNGNVLLGIFVGLIAAFTYNKFSETELPTAFSFFSGKRLVPILTAFFSMGLAILFFFIWPYLFTGLVHFGEWILNFGPIGAGIYGFFNRLLIPTGLHHALNTVFWFDVAGVDDINKFLSGDGAVKGETGRYMAGFYPVMMFGIPAAALAMYHTAESKQKKQVASLMLAGSISAFVVGITEPIEFAFMFAAPALFVVHAVLTGLSMFIAASFQWTAGFSFSAGLLDMIMSLLNPVANKPWMLIVQGLVFFVIYYLVFRFAIQIFNLNTPGRGKAKVNTPANDSQSVEGTDKKSKYDQMSINIIEGLGGKSNITVLTNCATRLRLELKDNNKVDETKIKSTGAIGVQQSGAHQTQVIIGPQVQQVSDAMERKLEE